MVIFNSYVSLPESHRCIRHPNYQPDAQRRRCGCSGESNGAFAADRLDPLESSLDHVAIGQNPGTPGEPQVIAGIYGCSSH